MENFIGKARVRKDSIRVPLIESDYKQIYLLAINSRKQYQTPHYQLLDSSQEVQFHFFEPLKNPLSFFSYISKSVRCSIEFIRKMCAHRLKTSLNTKKKTTATRRFKPLTVIIIHSTLFDIGFWIFSENNNRFSNENRK